jgi:hypothetical protein
MRTYLRPTACIIRATPPHGRHQQMHVVGHEHIRVYPAAVRQRCLAKVMQVPHVVGLAKEAGPTIVATLDDVLGDVREIEPGLARHRASFFAKPRYCRSRYARQVVNTDVSERESGLGTDQRRYFDPGFLELGRRSSVRDHDPRALFRCRLQPSHDGAHRSPRRCVGGDQPVGGRQR